MRKWIIGILVAIYVVSVAAVIIPFNIWKVVEEDSKKPEETDAEELDVFIVSDAIHDYSEEEEKVRYTTFFSVGNFDRTGKAFGEEGFLFGDAIEKYAQKTGVHINLKWYESPYDMEIELQKMSGSKMPDVIISNYASVEDYYLYMDQGMFFDLMPYLEEHEMYSEDQYYTQILQGGELNQKQYIMPILFSVDAVMGSTETLNKFAIHLNEIENHTQLMDALIYAQNQETDGMVAFQGNQASSQYLPHIIYSASGEEWIDYESMSVSLDQTRFERMCTFYEQYLNEQFEEGEIQKGEDIPWGESKELQIKIVTMTTEEGVQIDSFLGDIGSIVNGGSSMQLTLHSAAAHAWFYESHYADREEEFQIKALPNEKGTATAHITYFGGVYRSAENPKVAFDFLKYLMDTEVDAFFGLSVNKENAAKQLEYLTNTSYRLRPTAPMQNQDGTIANSKLDYVVQPMSVKTKEILEGIIDDVAVASLPNWPVYAILEEQLQKYAKGEIDQTEAYQNAVAALEKYAETGKNRGQTATEGETESLEEILASVEREEIMARVMSAELSEKIAAQKHHERMVKFAKILVLSVLLGVAIGVVKLVSRKMDKLNGKERTERVQIAMLDKDNGEAERNVRMTHGSESGLSSSMGRSTSDMVYMKVYRLDKKNRVLRLKLPAEYTRELDEGDIGELTYIGEEVLSFDKTGTIKDEDQKRIKFRV